MTGAAFGKVSIMQAEHTVCVAAGELCGLCAITRKILAALSREGRQAFFGRRLKSSGKKCGAGGRLPLRAAACDI